MKKNIYPSSRRVIFQEASVTLKAIWMNKSWSEIIIFKRAIKMVPRETGFAFYRTFYSIYVNTQIFLKILPNVEQSFQTNLLLGRGSVNHCPEPWIWKINIDFFFSVCLLKNKNSNHSTLYYLFTILVCHPI